MAVVYGGVLTFKSLRESAPGSMQVGRAFSLKTALLFASLIAVVQLLAAALNAKFGSNGVIVGSALAGFADSHAPAVSVASLAASGKLDAHASILAVLAGLTTNTFTKMVVAILNGGRRFALQIIPGLILIPAPKNPKSRPLVAGTRWRTAGTSGPALRPRSRWRM